RRNSWPPEHRRQIHRLNQTNSVCQTKSRLLQFKTLQVVPFFDRQRNVLVYVAYSERVIEGTQRTASAAFRSWLGPNHRQWWYMRGRILLERHLGRISGQYVYNPVGDS